MPTKADWQSALAICAAIIGAGFASGREIVSFFSGFSAASWLGIPVSAAGIGLLIYVIMLLAARTRARSHTCAGARARASTGARARTGACAGARAGTGARARTGACAGTGARACAGAGTGTRARCAGGGTYAFRRGGARRRAAAGGDFVQVSGVWTGNRGAAGRNRA